MIPTSRAWLLSFALVSKAALAHFILEAPKASLEQNFLGDPQKAPPCGEMSGSAPSGVVTTFVAGQTVTVTVNETIFHPGHYRVALGLTGPQDIPAEPLVTAGATPCGSVPIEAAPAFPILADGLLLHSKALSGSQSFQVKLPADVTCTGCTLQVLEFMSNHGLNNPGGCFYHHCANIKIVPSDGGVVPGSGVEEGGTRGCGCQRVDAAPLLIMVGLWFRGGRRLRRVEPTA